MVDLIWSESDGSEIVTAPVDLGQGGYNLTDPAEVQLYLRHNGDYPISNVRLYIGAYSDTYEGVEDPQTDYDAVLDGVLGVLQINIDYENDFPSASWQTVTENYASSVSTAIDLGTIPAGDTSGISIKLRFDFNASISDQYQLGDRQVDLKTIYAYTS